MWMIGMVRWWPRQPWAWLRTLLLVWQVRQQWMHRRSLQPAWDRRRRRRRRRHQPHRKNHCRMGSMQTMILSNHQNPPYHHRRRRRCHQSTTMVLWMKAAAVLKVNHSSRLLFVWLCNTLNWRAYYWRIKWHVVAVLARPHTALNRMGNCIHFALGVREMAIDDHRRPLIICRDKTENTFRSGLLPFWLCNRTREEVIRWRWHAWLCIER